MILDIVSQLQLCGVLYLSFSGGHWLIRFLG